LAHRARRSHQAQLATPEFLIVDGAPGLDKAIAAVWDAAQFSCREP
jgi:MinD superfamily P-loop ATPase